MKYADNPNTLQSAFVQISNTSNFLVGPVTVTRIVLSPSTSTCLSNPLFSALDLKCVPPYTMQNKDSRYIEGVFGTYSVRDGVTDLVFDLSQYFPPLTYRMMAMEFTVYNANTNNVGVCRVIFERSSRGDFHTMLSNTVLPPQFLYVGRAGGTAMEWIVLVGHIAIAIVSIFFILFSTIHKLFSRDPLKSFLSDIHFVIPVVIASVCISSFGYQISVTFSNPLITANLGSTESVNLQDQADTFHLVNNLNSINIVLMSIYFLWGHVMPRSGIQFFFSILSSLVVWIVIFSLILTIRYPTLFDSYSSTFGFVVSGILGDVNWTKIELGGFPLTLILITMMIGIYWITGITIGTLMYCMRKSVDHCGTVSESSFVTNVRNLSLYEKISKFLPKPTFDKKEETNLMNELHPELLAQLAAHMKSPLTNKDEGEKPTEMNDDEFLACVEIMTENAFSTISDMKTDVEGSLKQVKSQLETVRWTIRETYRYIK